MEQYDSHDLFRADNREAMEIRKKSSVAAMEDAALWLKEEGNVAVSKVIMKFPHLMHLVWGFYSVRDDNNNFKISA